MPVTAQWIGWIKRYAGWAALASFVAAIFSGLIAAHFVFPLALFLAAAALAAFHFWEQLKTFDFWALDEWARMRYDSIGVPDWHSPHHAAEIYCSQVVVKTRNEAAAEMNIIMMEIIKGREYGARSVDSSLASFNEKRFVDLDRDEQNAKYDAAQIRFNQCNAALSREMLTYLARGHLLAKGLPTKDDVAQSERIIPTSRWRVMNLDIAKAQATGMGWHYTGIVVGVKPKPRKTAKPSTPQVKPPGPSDKPAVRGYQRQRSDQSRPSRPPA
jgi:hypothetical protein